MSNKMVIVIILVLLKSGLAECGFTPIEILQGYKQDNGIVIFVFDEGIYNGFKICKLIAKIMVERVLKTENIEVLFEHLPKEVVGDQNVNGVIVHNKKTGKDYKVEVEGFFLATRKLLVHERPPQRWCPCLPARVPLIRHDHRNSTRDRCRT